MGCAASTIHNKDGTVVPGKGQVDIALDKNFSIDVMWAWTDESIKKVTCQLKVLPDDPKKLKEAKFEDKASGKPGVHIVNTRPTVQHQRWVIETDAGPVNIHYPGEKVPDLCKKIYGFHKKDPEKFPKIMIKAASKKEGHAYNSNPDKAKTDCDALEKAVNPIQMSDDMEPLKEGLVTLENLLPGNDGTVIGSIEKGLGVWKAGPDDVPELSMLEKGLAMKDEKLQGDPVQFEKVMDAKEKAMRQGTTVVMTGACKALGTTPQDLLPDLPGWLDMANGKKPFCQNPYSKLEQYQKHMGDAAPPTKEEKEEERKKVLKHTLEEDKKVEAEKREQDKNYEELKKKSVERLEKSIEYCRQAVAPAEESKLVKGTRVLAQWKTFGWYEGTLESGVKNGPLQEKKADDAKKDDEKDKDVKHCSVKFDDGDIDNVAIENIALEMPEQMSPEDMYNGAKCRARFFGGIFMDGTIKGLPNPDGTYVVNFDLIYTQKDVKPADIRRPFDLSLINKRGYFIPKTFYDVNFTWIQAEEDLDIKLRIWREFDEGNVQEVKLDTFTNKKKNPDGTETTEKVHGGYRAKFSMWRDRWYCYNFQVGEEYFVDYKKPVEKEGFRKICLHIG